MAIPVPDSTTRWRCSRCGNLTRFDVLRTKRSKQYWHFDLGGSSTIEEETALVDDVEKVTCRWCGADDSVELVARVDDV